jgi:hypothetical protein
VAVQDGSLRFLFENKEWVYNGKGFEMLAALNQHCHPDSVANAFPTLLLLFNDSMGVSEEIMAFCSWFDGMVKDMALCKIFLPPILIVMFFLHSLHSCYNDCLEQFCSRYKSLEGASLDSLWRTSTTTMSLSWLGRIRNFLWSKLLKWWLLLPPLKRINRERSGTTRMNGLPLSTSKA